MNSEYSNSEPIKLSKISYTILCHKIKGNIFKGQLQRFYKLVPYERAVKIPKNDICVTEIGQAVLEIFEFKVEFPRKIPKIRNFANVSTIRVEQ